MLLVPLLGAIIAGVPSPAQARCDGIYNPVISNLATSPGVHETPAAGTCDGNGTYTSTLTLTGGGPSSECAEFWARNAGVWNRWGLQCGGGSSVFSYADGSSHPVVLCYRNSAGTRWCGWGASSTTGGVNAAYSAGFYGTNSGQ